MNICSSLSSRRLCFKGLHFIDRSFGSLFHCTCTCFGLRHARTCRCIDRLTCACYIAGKKGEDGGAAASPSNFLKAAKELGQDTVLHLLAEGAFDKRVPIRCRVCRSRSQVDGKVFEGHSLKYSVLHHFIKQHCKSASHVAGLARYVSERQAGTDTLSDPQPLQGDASTLVPCQGFSLTHGATSVMAADFALWAKFVKFNNLQKHVYKFDLGAEELVVMHQSCFKFVTPPEDGGRPVCQKCSDKELARAAIRGASRMVMKYWLSQVLQGRLFKSGEFVDSAIAEFKSTGTYTLNRKKCEEILQLSNGDLQKYLRQSWNKTRHDSGTDLMHTFRETLVNPCMFVNVADCQDEVKALSTQFTMQLGSGNLSELNKVTCKILSAVGKGRIANNPAIMGIFLQCLEKLDRDSRGVGMRGGRKMSETEALMVQEAADLLSMNGCSPLVMKELGFNVAACKARSGKVDSLLSDGLPNPALSLLWPQVLRQNLALIDGMFERSGGAQHMRRMVLCFDFTYLLPMHTCLELNQQKGIVGAPFCMNDLDNANPGCFQKIVPGRRLQESMKANRMLLACLSLKVIVIFLAVERLYFSASGNS